MEKKKRKIDEVMEELQIGVKAVFETENYRKWLSTLAHFHQYSLNNCLLIAMQRPDAERVASVRTWNKLGRHVKSGEHGIRILVPTPVKISKEDDDSLEERKLLRFKVGHVFDLSQTEGAPLPELGISELTGDVKGYEKFVATAVRISPVLIRTDEIKGSAKGYYSPAKKEIVLREGMSEMQTAKTLLHELVHAFLHNRDRLKEDGNKDRQTKEVEAESCAYVLMKALLGLDSKDYSFSYIAGWSSGKEIPELMASLKTIHDTSAEIINMFNEQMKEGEGCA